MRTVKRSIFLLSFCFLLAAGVGPVPQLGAQHVVWVDYSTRSFNPQIFNNISIRNSRSWDDVKARIIKYLAEDYANYEIQFVPFKPEAGRYTRLIIGGDALGGASNVLGTSLPWGVCQASECGVTLQATDHGSWRTDKESIAFVFSDNSAGSSLTGSTATIGRIASAIGKTASHELGHIIGLEHWFAVDSYEAGFALPQGSSQVNTTTQNSSARIPHVMGTGLSVAMLADSSFRFSPHISNEHLMQNLGTRGYHLPLANFNRPSRGTPSTADLLIGEMTSTSAVSWDVSSSSGRAFGSPVNFVADGGDPADVYLTGDVNGDGAADLVYGRASSATSVRWFVRLSTGSGFGAYETWVSDAGDVGDVFRIGDVNGDGKDDLLYGRPSTGNHNASAIPLQWFVRLSTGSAFGQYSEWIASAGYQGHPVFVRDFNRDGQADLITARIPAGQPGIWNLYTSTGQGFASSGRLYAGTGADTDRLFLDDVSGDGVPDLIIGRRVSRNQIRWYVRRAASGPSFEATPHIWIEDAGDSGDIFRVGDVTGDGLADLVIMRRDQPTGSSLWVSASTGAKFSGPQRWGANIGQDGLFVY
jgi:hypothetical protein